MACLSYFLCKFTALSIYMLLVFEIETGIASVCVLSSGVLVLLVLVAHALVRAACTSKHFHNQHINTVYQNDPESSAGICTVASELSLRENPTKQRGEDSTNHLFSYTEPKQQYSSEREAYGASGRMHRTLSTESSLLHTHTKPWNSVNHEMRTVLTRKVTGKDSTLVWVPLLRDAFKQNCSFYSFWYALATVHVATVSHVSLWRDTLHVMKFLSVMVNWTTCIRKFTIQVLFKHLKPISNV